MKLTKKQREFLTQYESTACNISATCKKINISRSKYYSWVKSNKYFQEKVNEIKESLIDFAETMLYKKIKEGNLKAIIFYLATQGRDRGYDNKLKLETNEILVKLPPKGTKE